MQLFPGSSLVNLILVALQLADFYSCLWNLDPNKRRYISASGMHKIKRYLQRKYNNEHVPEPLLRRSFYTNSWAVLVDPPTNFVADKIAEKHGFINIGQIGNIPGQYHFKHDDTSSKIEKRDIIKTGLLQTEKNVKFAMQQIVLDRYKRDGFPTDPEFPKMWYLHNNGQGRNSPAGVDLDVQKVWEQNITGRGVVISVLDDGLDRTHPDLSPNYDAKASCDLNDNDDDPMPRDTDPDNCHGTRCAGEAVAVANNSICGVGVAYNAKIGGVRMLDGQATDALEASALGFNDNHIDIYINCWGPKDDGKTFGKPGPLATDALQLGAEKGRGGKGVIYVWATGNGGLTDDDCNCDGYTTSIYTISIGCIGDHGTSAYYTEKCSSTLAVTFNGASHKEGKENKMITTDLYHGCTEEFKGTSASAPLAAGLLALVLEVNPELTWRDVQELIVKTAQITSPVEEGWKKNGVGYHYNLKFGFGRLDARRMVEAAKTWKSVGPHRKCVTASSSKKQDIPRSGTLNISVNAVECAENNKMISKVEHVILTISVVHQRRGDLSIDLYSAKGTQSDMLSTRKYDDSNEGLDEWNFMTVFNWGENPTGEWSIIVSDKPEEAANPASENADDVETLEENVINAQMKGRQEKWAKTRQQSPYFDVPYPSGVRKDNIEDTLKQQKDNPFDRTSHSDVIDKQYLLPWQRESTLSEELNGDDVSYNNNNNNNNNNNVESIYEDGALFEIGGGSHNSESGGTNQEQQKKSRINIKSNDKFVNTRNSLFGTNHKYKKVQVQAEETGVPRVQVNAGYENPEIKCEGTEPCAGVLLFWKLTFFGSD